MISDALLEETQERTQLTLAQTPFVVQNGATFEVHDFGFDGAGKRWEVTVDGPYSDESGAYLTLRRLRCRNCVMGSVLVGDQSEQCELCSSEELTESSAKEPLYV